VARTQRAHVALEDPTTLPQRPHSALSNTLCKTHSAAFVLSIYYAIAQRLHSVSTALLATAQPTPWRSATFLTL